MLPVYMRDKCCVVAKPTLQTCAALRQQESTGRLLKTASSPLGEPNPQQPIKVALQFQLTLSAQSLHSHALTG